jgi:hypothetical protein
MAIKNLSDVHITAGLQDKDGQLGTSGQILSSTGSQVDWIDQEDIVIGEADKAKSVTIRVKNSTAIAMSKGQVICEAVSASPPNGNLIEVALADNNGTNTMPALGILNEDLDAAGGANDEGDAIMFGKVSGINTSAFSVGDEVFVDDTPGGLTITKPTGTKYIQKVGVVIRDDASNGTIEVFGAGRVNDVPTPLYVDHANQRLGIGKTSPQKTLDVDGEVLLREHLFIGGHGENDSTNSIEIGRNRTGNGICFFDMTTDNTTYTDFGFRLIRYSGVDANTELVHRGTGNFSIKGQEASNVTFSISNSERMRIASNGNVGIGTTGPAYKLDVNSSEFVGARIESTASGYAPASILLESGNADSRGQGIYQYNSVSKNSWFSGVPYSTTSDDWVIAHKLETTAFNSDVAQMSNALFCVNDNGNVGIGTTDPGHKLEVEGSANNADIGIRINNTFDDNNPASNPNSVLFLNAASNNGYLRVHGAPANTAAKHQIDLGSTAASSFLTFSPSGSERMRITSTGNVGIGTTSPSDKLEVNGTGVFGTGSAYALKLKSSSGARGIEISDNNGVDRGGIDWSASDFVIRNASDANLFKINYSSKQTNLYGNLDVSVAPTAPWMNLVNSGETAFRLTTYNNGTNNGSSAYAFKHGLYYNTTENAAVTFWRGGSGTGGFLTFTTNNGAERMRIDSSGNVGIGTTSPGYNLVVGDGTQDTESRFYFSDGSYTSVRGYGLYMSRTFSYIRPVTDESQTLNIGALNSAWGTISNNASLHTFGKDSTEFMRINSSGNVGIGTTNPLEKLHVEGNLELQGNFTIGSTSGNYWQRIRTVDSSLSTGNAFNFETRNGSGAYLQHMVIRNDGNVGIGTTSPSQKLEVAGNIQATGSRRISAYYDANHYMQIEANASGGVIKGTDGGVTTTLVRTYGDSYLNGGKVGIGTTSPGTKLDVIGSTQSTDFKVGSSGTMQIFDYSGNLHIYSTAGTDILLGGGVGARQNDVTIGNGDLIVNGDIAADNFISVQGLDTGNPSASSEELRLSGYGFLGNRSAMYITNGHATGTLRFGAGGSGGNHGSNTKMVLNSSGNLGIGTTSPTKKLQISHSGSNDGLLLEHTSQASGFQILQNIRQTEGLIWQKQTSGSFTSNLMTLGYDGNLGIGTTSPGAKLEVTNNSGGTGIKINPSGGYGQVLIDMLGAGYGTGIQFKRNSSFGSMALKLLNDSSSTVGSITVNSSSTSYNTSSDYRLKENIVPITNGIDRVKSLKPCRFNFIEGEDNAPVDGFIAHETADVVPESVTGEKDAVDIHGNPEYQGIDQSKIVPLLTAALKEAIEKIEQLENRIQTLENN